MELDLKSPTARDKAIEDILVSRANPRQKRALLLTQRRPYDQETQRPLICLVFVLPLVVLYEIGTLWIGPSAVRSGIDQWIHQALQLFGIGQLVLLPVLTVAVLLAWHHRKQDHWQIPIRVLGGMLVEAVGLGLILFFAANAIQRLMFEPSLTAGVTMTSVHWWATAMAHVGSGIYEELIFRIVLLVPIIFWLNQSLGNRKLAIVLGVIAVSLLFAAVHYSVFNPAGNPFELSSFAFRFGASIVFCVLFLFRGFGIAVGTHVAYDLLTQI